MKPVHSFIVTAQLPKKIEKLKELAYNYWWCWNSEAKELFLRIDRELWEEVDHNPVLLINKMTSDKLEALAKRPDFTNFLDYIHDKFTKYMNDQTWFSTNHSNVKGTIAYFSTEYGINESFPNYSGGLGVLSGDHVKSSSDLGIPLIAVGLLYQQGYFRQHLTQHGWQNELYKYNDFDLMPLVLVRNKKGEPLICEVDLPYGKAFFQIWKLQIGNVPLYLLDTNIDQNGIAEYRNITDQLYGGTRDTRIQQEIVLGIGGTRALTAMGIEPEAYHINEGHAAFSLLERTRNYMEKYQLDFESAKQITKATSVFTTHTPVPAGNESFRYERMENYLNHYYQSLGLDHDKFYSYGQAAGFNKDEGFSMTILGLRLTTYHNGVSKLHGEVSRNMWHSLWKCFPVDEVPIGHVTNGIHTNTWISREFSELFDRYLSPAWRTDSDNQEIWDQISTIPNEELWREKQRRRVRLVLFARKHMQRRHKAFLTPDQSRKINEYLNPDALTIGFARRFATYKRALLLFADMDRLRDILTNEERPVQIILAGKAHPHDTQGKEVIQSIIHKVREYGLERHVVFLEDYDMVLARFMVKGCDIWLNNPVRPMEASGTSGMKAAINGCINFSILDGWWDEAFNGKNGFAIGTGEEYEDVEQQNSIDSGNIYDTLEQVIVQQFYTRDSSTRIPEKWVAIMKDCITSISGEFSTARMLKDYANKYYIPALNNYKGMTSNKAKNSAELQNWKNRVRSEWNAVEILEVSVEDNMSTHIGQEVTVAAKVTLGGLAPEDVSVQVYFGTVNHLGDMVNTAYANLQRVSSDGTEHDYKGKYKFRENGKQGFTVRILPTNKLMVNSADLHLCAWAS
jgi:glycogen phosphorylase